MNVLIDMIRKKLDRCYNEKLSLNNIIIIFFHSVYLLIKRMPSKVYNYFLFVIYYRRFLKYFCNEFSIGVKLLCINRVVLPHPLGIVIGEGVKIGKSCTIYQGVTIGRLNKETSAYPRIGNNVTIYTGAVIIGDITIGDDCIIGAGCIVKSSLEKGTILRSS